MFLGDPWEDTQSKIKINGPETRHETPCFQFVFFKLKYYKMKGQFLQDPPAKGTLNAV